MHRSFVGMVRQKMLIQFIHYVIKVRKQTRNSIQFCVTEKVTVNWHVMQAANGLLYNTQVFYAVEIQVIRKKKYIVE